jgi:trk system potassium uptake protein TrkH
MDYGIVLRVLGFLLIIEAGSMLLPLGVALYYGGPDIGAFAVAILVTAAAGIAGLRCKPTNGVVRYREAFMIVGLGWLLASGFGSLPFLLAGTLPSVADAFFETVSGFTTTGATVISNIEVQPYGILFWRSFTHWLGGMGIIVFTLAVLPALGLGSMRIFQAESPGPTPTKLVPRVDQTAKLLYGIYIALTILQMIALKITGMSWFDSITHTFATMGTGGFSTRNASVGGFGNAASEWVIAIFMFAAAVNFSLYYGLIHRKWSALFKDEEFRFYGAMVVGAALLVGISIFDSYKGQLGKVVRDAFFQVVSIVTTTGFITVDYEKWPELSKMILFFLIFVGGCAGSTGGGLKQVRILLIFKAIKRKLYKLMHPKAVIPIVLGDSPVPEETVDDVLVFTLFYLLIFAVMSMLLLTQGLDAVSSMSAVAATMGNVGPGFGLVGPTTSYADLTTLTKIMLSICMLLGRLEIFPLVALAMPNFWRKA